MTIHQIPLGEDRPHQVDRSENCWCGPKTRVELGERQVDHQEEPA